MDLSQAKALAENNLSLNGGLYNESNDISVDSENLNKFDPAKRFGVKISGTLDSQKRLILHPGLLEAKRPVKVTWYTDDIVTPTESYTFYYAKNGIDKIIIKDYGVAIPPSNEHNYYMLVDDDVEKLIDNGVVADGVMRDGVVIQEADKNLKVEGITGSTIEFFRDFVSENPTLIKRLVINSNDTSVYSNTIFEKPITPFMDKAERKVFLNDYFSVNSERTEKITIDLDKPLHFDDEHVISMDVPGASAGETVEITMEFIAGATQSKSAELKGKAEISRKRDEILKTI